MLVTLRESWALIHGVLLGGGFMLAFAGGLIGIYGLQAQLLTPEGIRDRVRQLNLGTIGMAVIAWITVISGTFIVYPWYRAKAPEGAELALYPKAYLLANGVMGWWHTFGMEWKEHIAWISPILATAVAYIVWKYGSNLAKNDTLRKIVLALFTLAFLTAAVAGLFGAMITKAAPIR